MLPTLSQVLALDAVRRGQPRVLAGTGELERPVRWVHAIELTDAARLLRGGELVLTTGIALPDDDGLLARYAGELASAGVSGLAVELGRRYTRGLPAGLVAAAREHGLPLIVFEREVPFVDITEAVHARIIDDQLGELRTAARLHEVFTDLAVAGAGPEDVIRQAALLAGRPVILADLAHHVLACEPSGADPATLLERFESRSRAVVFHGRTAYDEPAGWLVTTVGARGEDWGRLILVCGAPPRPADTVLVERAATTLALGRLLARQHQSLERHAHATLISAIRSASHGDPGEAAVRARALGVPVTGRQLVPVVIRFPGGGPGLSAQAQVLEVADLLAAACRAERVPALAGALDEARAGALLSLDRAADVDRALAAVCETIRHRLRDRSRRPADAAGGLAAGGEAGRPPAGARRAAGSDPIIGVGSVVGSMPEVRRSLLEAEQVADAAALGPAGPGRLFYRLADLRLRGLLQLLSADARLATFVDRELGPLLAYDAAHGAGLIGVLSAYLAVGGNKAETAARAHLARPTLYERLRRIERILGVSLDAPESRTSLHVAMLALDAAAEPTPEAGRPPRR